MVICAERLMAKNAGETMRAYATNVKLQALHKVAQYDNQEYQEKLVAFAKECETEKDKASSRRPSSTCSKMKLSHSRKRNK